MSNPFIQNIPTDNSVRISPTTTTSIPPNPNIVNYPLSSTGFNSGSTYLSNNNNVNGVTSVNNINGAVNISSTNGNLTVSEVGNDIELTVLAGGIGVETVNNLVGAVTISSANGNLTVTENGNDIELTVLAGGIGVESLETLAGNIALTSTGNTVAITTVGQNINFEAVVPPLGGVTSLKTLTGAVDITSTGGTVGITTVGQNINLEALGVTPVSDWANFPAVNAVNIPDRNLNMTSSTPGIAYSKATLNANVDIGTLTNAPVRPDLNAYCGIVTFGGITSPLTAMNINSIGPIGINSGLGVSIAGGGGVAITGGGAVTVNSVGGVLIDGGGAISINGIGGISIVGSGALSIASGGILVSAGGVAVNGGGVVINAGGLNVLAGATAIGSAGLAGGGLNVYGSDLSLLPVGPFTSSLKTDLITSQSGTPTLAISNVATINGLPYPPSGGVVYQGTYTKSTNQALVSGNNLISFDGLESWNNIGSYITHTNGTTVFTVGIAGLYQLEGNIDVNDTNATYTTTSNKTLSIFLTRATVLKAIIQNSCLQATAQTFQMSLSSSYYLNVGDIIQVNLFNSFTGTAPSAIGVDTFALNTFFTWRYVSQ